MNGERMRNEKGSLGSVAIPHERYYGIHTAGALENFGDITDRHDTVSHIYHTMKQTGRAVRELIAVAGVLSLDEYDSLVAPDVSG